MQEALRSEDLSVSAMLAHRDLVLVTGKGGTGKTTLVAALAELAALRRGRAVAVEISAHPRLRSLVDPAAHVEVVNLNLEEATVSSLGRILGLPGLVGAVAKNRVIRQFVRTSPAARETILLDELRFLVEKSTQDNVPVIVDLPATGHAVSLLDTPRTVRKMLKVGPVASAAERAERLLLDPRRCELVVVAVPEELPINETIELVQRAHEIGVASHRVVVNQVPAAPVAAHEREILEVVQRHGEGALGRFAKTAHGDSQGADQARALIERLKRSVRVQTVEVAQCALADPRACVEAMKAVLSR